MSYPGANVKHMFDIKKPGLAPGNIVAGRVAPVGPAPDPDLAAVPLERLEAQICEVAGHLAAATCRFLVLLAEFDERRGWASWEMNSCAQWLSWKCQMSSGTAREHVRVARSLRDLPVIRREFAAGRLSYAKVRALTRIATPVTEAGLAEMAGPMTGNQLERFARAHRQCSRADDAAARVRRRFTWRFEDDGSLAGSFRLPPLAGAVLLKALRAAAAGVEQPGEDGDGGQAGVSAETPPAGKPVLTTSSDLADALVMVAESFLAGKVAGADDAEVYQVVLHVGTGAITAPPAAEAGVSAETPAPAPPPGDPADPARCHVEDGPAVSVTTAQMIGCTAALSWMRHGRDGQVLDLGRRRRRPNAALRKAARERDRGRCRFPGCESRRVDLHHIQHWAHGGRTSLDNLISLCKRHHMAVHDRGYLIATRDDGTFTIYDPGGTAIPPSPALPEPDGGIAGVHDADITPETIIPPWHGERLDLDNAIYTCLANERIQQDRAAGRDRHDDIPPRHPMVGQPVYLIDAIREHFSGRTHPHPPVQIPTPV
jgi:5-methylcytosine-specific restriction endonuclease McrA